MRSYKAGLWIAVWMILCILVSCMAITHTKILSNLDGTDVIILGLAFYLVLKGILFYYEEQHCNKKDDH